MATTQLTLRPISDSSISHSKSSGNNGYSLLSESSSDGDSTYIYQSVTSTTSRSVNSTFNFAVTSLPSNAAINSVKVFTNARITGGSGSISASIKLDGTNYNVISSTNLSTSYASQSGQATMFQPTPSSITLTITTTGKKSSSKDDDTQVRITQCYLEITATTYDNALFVKSNNTVKQVTNIYRKTNGVWNEIQCTDLDRNANYVRGN